MRTSTTSLFALGAASASFAAVVPRWQHALSCSDLWDAAPKMLSNLEVYVAENVAAGTNFTTPYATASYPSPVPDMPAVCRFGAYIHTSNISKVQFEVWLPDEWSGRYAMVGNGGDAGGVNFPDMWAPAAKYQMAVASTDTGHNNSGLDSKFGINNDPSLIDFGYRAVHLTNVYSKKILAAYYGKEQKSSYWFGCSSGGKQGLKEVQMYPEDFDGVIAGAAAQFWNALNAQTYRVNAIVNPVNTTRHLGPSDYAKIGALVMNQCDGLDGVVDGYITNPALCHPDLSSLNCAVPYANQSTCLRPEQIDTMYTIWGTFVTQTDVGFPKGTFVFPGFEPGAENSPRFSVTGVPFGPAPSALLYQVLNSTDPNATLPPLNQTELERLYKISVETDPGRPTAGDPNIQPFLKRGKLLTYVGLADSLIPSGSTLHYRELVNQALGYPDNLDDSYRTFTIPGMDHCAGGPGPNSFGAVGQRQDVLGGSGQPLSNDKEHDMILAMIDWVENNNAPDQLIAVKYKNDNKTQGVSFTRPLCPYPRFARYIGGDNTQASSFKCATAAW
ncbi:hypothetical protein JCM10908_000144 [Rhodotorula pacifica]|uniref:uncharacterized protein n=1 Tax=Rhodotorula pacifica TaxID=1495444 RepID=UPI00317929F4